MHLLDKEIANNSNKPDEAMATFLKAHQLLDVKKSGRKKIQFVLRRIGKYKDFYDHFQTVFSDEQRQLYLMTAFDMNKQFLNYFQDIGENNISPEIKNAYREYRKLFMAYPEYRLQISKTDNIFNQLVRYGGINR